MVGAYLAVVRPPQSFGDSRLQDLLARARRECAFETVFDDGRLLVLANHPMPTVPIAGGAGVVLGTLFRRDGYDCTPIRELAQTVSASPDAALIQSYWGGYIAFVVQAGHGTIRVLRDPSGALACYRSEYAGLTLFYSDITTTVRLGLVERRLDLSFAAHHLAYPDLRTARTGIVGVEEVLAGQMVGLGQAEHKSMYCWTPWSFAAADKQIKDRRQAVDLMSSVIQHCVRAWASQSNNILLELSGGLDSSIVAACLQSGGAAMRAVTLATPDPGADEREYAKRIAERFNITLDVIGLEVERGKVGNVSEHLSPRPGAGALQRVIDDAILHYTAGIDLDAFFGGGGGDSVFCFLGTAAPAADVLRIQGFSPLFWQTIGNLAALHDCTRWTATRLAIKKAWRRPKSWRPDLMFLADDAVPRNPEAHPWLVRPRNALPGKIEHISALMRVQGLSDGKARARIAPYHYPLLSQPLVELCLRIPSWMWVDGGRNRSVARDAFADALPEEILRRRSKGDFTGFCGAIFERQRRVLAELLLDGWLARESIVDRAAIERYLTGGGPHKDLGFYRLLDIAAVETWARSWLQAGP